jgi:GNAT superfamily N-acetyltransferase
MDDIEGLRQADLDPGAVDAALALSTAVGWNQTAEDWVLFLTRGRVIGSYDWKDRLVATAATLPYEGEFGWISMVIVTAAWRRRGIAHRMMLDCIDTLSRQRRAAFLDATPAGAEVYSRLGFVARGGMERWEGNGGAAQRLVGRSASDLADRLVGADRAAFGSDRGFLLRDFLLRDGTMALAAGDAVLVMRRGQRATQLGPFIAGSVGEAAGLLADAIDQTHGPVFLDLLDGWTSLVPLLESRGFRRQRPFRRMALGRTTLPGDSRRLVCAAGPEFG